MRNEREKMGRWKNVRMIGWKRGKKSEFLIFQEFALFSDLSVF
jgi:hypothetical protein